MRTGVIGVLGGAAIVLLAGCGRGESSKAGDAAPDGSADDAAEAGGGGTDADRDATVAGDAQPDGAGSADAATDTVADAGLEAGATDGPAGDGGLPCGSMTCAGDDLCVTVSTCPGAVMCTERPDGGSCPAGTIAMSCPTGRPGCVPTCPPPTSSCRPRPAACGATISCNCITSATCGGPSCASASGRNVFCAYQ